MLRRAAAHGPDCGMLGRRAPWRHLVVVLVVAACSLLALVGIIGPGAGSRSERFEAKQITVQPAGERGVRIREVVWVPLQITKVLHQDECAIHLISVQILVFGHRPRCYAPVGENAFGARTVLSPACSRRIRAGRRG